MRDQTNEARELRLAEAVQSTNQAYHEMSDTPVQQSDCLEEFMRNLNQLEDTFARYQFMMREVRYLMKL